jgi:amino acid adenylation domain-containing protein
MVQSQLSAVERVGFELSAQQKRLWRFGQAGSCRAIGIVQLHGEVDQALLNQALSRVVDRYEALRTTLHVEPSRRYPLQVVGHEPQITVDLADNLLRLELPGMFADFASLRNICGALAREYANAAGEAIVQYVDYAGWQQTLLDQDEAAEALAYWHVRDRRSFATQLLHTDINHNESAATSFDKEPESPLPDGLNRTFLLAAWSILLWRLTGEEPVVGVEFDGRTFAELDQTVGLFARWLPKSLKLNSRVTFEEVAREVALTEEKARLWQDYFELDAHSNSQERFAAGFEIRDLRRNSIFSLVDYDVAYEPCELKLVCTLRESGLTWRLHWAAGFTDADRSRISGCFAELIRSAISNPEMRINELPILNPEAFVDWSQTALEFPRYANLHELFESAVALNAQNEALTFRGRSWTFDELNRRANQLAHHLRRFGAGAETVVGLCLDHSDELVMAALAILKSGAAFVPLNPVLPTERLRSLAEKTSVSLIVTAAQFAPAFDNVSIVDIHAAEIENESDSNPASQVTPPNLAYVMFTSGSTGGPKGVMIQHGSLLNLAFALEEAVYSHAPHARNVSLNGPLSFDTSIKQLVQLCFGRRLCVVPPELRNTPSEFVEFLVRNEIDGLDCTPSHLRLLLDVGLVRPSLVLVGGEEFDRQTWDQASRSEIQFVNVYGPTECTVDATAGYVRDSTVPTLGRAIANVRTYILDDNGAPVPPGVIGELHIGGAGVGRGYFNAADLTASHFIPDRFSGTPGARLYQTGDFARYLANGEIEYRGRRDDQVKIRGSRVELNEVAEAIRQHPAVDQAVVLPQSSGNHEQILVAYVVFHRGTRVGANELRKSVVLTLPDFMTPARFVEVKSIPLTTSGKVDRQLLTALSDKSLDEGVVQQPPQTPTEETTAAIWREVLKQNAIGRAAKYLQ